jgi:hypothetical protein
MGTVVAGAGYTGVVGTAPTPPPCGGYGYVAGLVTGDVPGTAVGVVAGLVIGAETGFVNGAGVVIDGSGIVDGSGYSGGKLGVVVKPGLVDGTVTTPGFDAGFVAGTVTGLVTGANTSRTVVAPRSSRRLRERHEASAT